MTAVLFEFAANPALPEAEREQICEWLKGLDVDPASVKSGYVTAGLDGYQLRLLQYVRGENGAHILVPHQNRVQTVEHVVPLGDQATWPGAEVTGGDQQGDAAAGP